MRWVRVRPKLRQLIADRTEVTLGKKLALLAPADTRAGTLLIVSERLLRLREPLAQFFASNDFTAWRSELKTAAAREAATQKKNLLLSDDFFDTLQALVDIGTEIMKGLRVFDKDEAVQHDATLEHVKVRFYQLRRRIDELPLNETFTASRKDQLKALVLSKWEYVRRDVHEAAFALSPRYREHARDGSCCSGGDWWTTFGGRWPKLQPLAVLLDQPANVAPSERG